MKVKTSITLSEDVLAALAEVAPQIKSRSDIIEKAVWHYIKILRGKLRDGRDLKILNRRAKSLNAEAEDALSFQEES